MDKTPAQTFDRARSAFAAGRYAAARQLLSGLRSQMGDHPAILHLFGLAAAREGDTASADAALSKAATLATDTGIHSDWAEWHRANGDFDRAEQILRSGLRRFAGSDGLLRQLGLVKRDAGAHDDAALVFDHLLKARPDDPDALYLRALIELERGGDARPAFARAMAAAPGNRELLLGAAAAWRDSGTADEAIALLQRAAQADSPWPEGLRTLARLRSERGDGEHSFDDWRATIDRHPADTGLWAAYLGMLASGLRFETVLGEIARARRSAGDAAMFDLIEAQALTESGQLAQAEHAFDAIGAIGDPSFVPVRMRHLFRTQRSDEAARLGEAFIGGASANMIWPLLELAWRSIGDDRWKWLQRYDDMVGVYDLPLDAAELAAIASALRGLHRGSVPPDDQSARGGTQTTGNLFDRTDPAIRRLRALVDETVRQFIASLPQFDSRHPFLGQPRVRHRFAGSWSIRLGDGGFHVSHVHPVGWISSACYIALPPAIGRDDRHDGWLKLGEAPPELGLNLPVMRHVEPVEGRLVLFPSIMWHGTEAFDAGERLTAAFDVVPFTG